MSIPVFIIHALALSPQVFLRFLPALAALTVIVVGLFLSTDNPYVIGMLLLVLGTVGTSFLVLTGLRAGLMAVRATRAPTVELLMRYTIRLMISHLLVQLILYGTLVMTAGWVFYHFVLPDAAPQALTLFEALRADTPPDPATLPDPQVVAASLRQPLALFSLVIGVIGAFCVALFGVPMAAMAANAVQYSPQHDLIFGIGRYFPHLFLLYLLAMAVPGAVYALYAPPTALVPEAMPQEISLGAVGALAIGAALYSVFAPAIVFAGMGLAYKHVRHRVEHELMNERVPVIDRDAEREKLRDLRQVRKAERKLATVYDPKAQPASGAANAKPRPGPAELEEAAFEEEEDEDDTLAQLRRARHARKAQRSGPSIYDPLAARRAPPATGDAPDTDPDTAD